MVHTPLTTWLAVDQETVWAQILVVAIEHVMHRPTFINDKQNFILQIDGLVQERRNSSG